MTAVRVVENHKELENIGQVSHDEIDSALTGSNFLITSGTVGSNALSGSRVFTAGSNISFVDNGPGGTFVISSTGGAVGAGRVRAYDFSVGLGVPNAGIRYLKSGEVFLSESPVIVSKDIKLTGGSVSVNKPDTTNDYTLVIEVSGTTGFFDAETIVLSSTETAKISTSFSSIVSSSFGISAYLSRSLGSGRSDFDEVVITIEADEQ